MTARQKQANKDREGLEKYNKEQAEAAAAQQKVAREQLEEARERREALKAIPNPTPMLRETDLEELKKERDKGQWATHLLPLL